MVARRSRHGFSLVELAMVIATMGVIAMIAVPRMSTAVTTSKVAALKANLRVLQNALERYAAEHNDLMPPDELDGSLNDEGAFVKRLTKTTDDVGNLPGIYGPYLLAIPANPANGLNTVRISNDGEGKNIAGWRYDPDLRRIFPDHLTVVDAQALMARLGSGREADLRAAAAEPEGK